VTIVVGFRCSDGVVICADQQHTAPGAYKFNHKKLSYEEFDEFTAAFAYAGMPGIAKEAHEKITAALRQTPVSQTAIQTVQATTDAVLSQMGRLYTDLDLQMLIGVTSLRERADLLKFDGKAVHLADDFSCLAYGDSSLIRFLSDKLYSKGMNTKTGMNLGIYLVKKAEDYIDGCGGPIDVTVLGSSECSYSVYAPQLIQERVQRMEKQERLLADLLIRKPFSST
jgi:20S proteasome alpha/beta subunit